MLLTFFLLLSSSLSLLWRSGLDVEAWRAALHVGLFLEGFNSRGVTEVEKLLEVDCEPCPALPYCMIVR